MAAVTFTPNAVAREASKALGKPVTAKAVRGYARATMRRFDKTAHPAYQSHVYSAAERTAIVSGMKARAAGNAPKAASKPAKAASKPSKPIGPVVA